MVSTREQVEKLQAEADYAKAQGGQIHRGGYSVDETSQDPIIERFRSQLRSIERQTRKAERLAELISLLEKHPDVARILDLVDSVRF